MGNFFTGTTSGGGGLEVTEIDGIPDVHGVNKIIVTNGALVDNGGGTVTLDMTAGGSTVTSISMGTTGLTPDTDTDGIITVAGTLVVGHGGTGVTSLTDGGILLGSGTAALSVTAQPTDGQLLIGSTGFDPLLATLTGGINITITNSAGEILIDSDSEGKVNAGVAAQIAYYTDTDTIGGDSGLQYVDTPGSRLFSLTDASAGTMFKIESTAVSGASAPDIVFYRNNSAPSNGDDLGVIVFSGNRVTGTNETEYARISSEANTLADASGNGANGQLDFRVKRDGTLGTQLRITEQGLLINSGNHADTDFRIDTASTDYALFINAGVNTATFNVPLQIDASISSYQGATPTDGQLLIGDTATGLFDAATLTGGTNVTVTNAAGAITIDSDSAGTVAVGTIGQVAYYTAADALGGNNGHFWDNANQRLGIGTTNPQTQLHVQAVDDAVAEIRISRSSTQYFEIMHEDSNGTFIRGVSDESNKKGIRIDATHDDTGSANGTLYTQMRIGRDSNPTLYFIVTEDNGVALGNEPEVAVNPTGYSTINFRVATDNFQTALFIDASADTASFNVPLQIDASISSYQGATPTDGQLLIGNSAGTFDAATLTGGTNVTVTNAAGAITIDSDSAGTVAAGTIGQVGYYTATDALGGSTGLTWTDATDTLLIDGDDARFLVTDTTQNYMISLLPASGPKIQFGTSAGGGQEEFMSIGATNGKNRIDSRLRDFIIENDNTVEAFTLLGASTGYVGIHNSAPDELLHMVGGNLKVQSSLDGGATAAPNIEIYRNSDSPVANDLIGQVLFSGDTTTQTKVDYGAIIGSIADGIGTTFDGEIEFQVARQGAMGPMMNIGMLAGGVRTVTVNPNANSDDFIVQTQSFDTAFIMDGSANTATFNVPTTVYGTGATTELTVTNDIAANSGLAILRLLNKNQTDSDFEIRHDAFGNTYFYSNQPDTPANDVEYMRFTAAGLFSINHNLEDIDFTVKTTGSSTAFVINAGADTIATNVPLQIDASISSYQGATPTDGQLLIGNSAGLFNAATLTGGTNVTVTNAAGAITIDSDSAGTVAAGTIGQVAYYTATDALGGNSGLFWDTATQYLGIGTNSPDTQLHIQAIDDNPAIPEFKISRTDNQYFAIQQEDANGPYVYTVSGQTNKKGLRIDNTHDNAAGTPAGTLLTDLRIGVLGNPSTYFRVTESADAGSGIGEQEVSANPFGYNNINFRVATSNYDAIFADASADTLTFNVPTTINQQSTGAAGLTIIEDSNTATAAPDLVMYRNSSNPANGDDLAHIHFKGNHTDVSGTASAGITTYGDIFVDTRSVVTGAESARIFHRMMVGGALTEAITLRGDNGGEVVINDNSLSTSNIDFRVETDDETSAFFVDSSGNFLETNVPTYIKMEDGAANTVLREFVIRRQTNHATPAIGIGVGINFSIETSASNYENAAFLDAVTTNVSGAGEDIDFVFNLMENGATAAERLRLTSGGALSATGIITGATGITATAGDITAASGVVNGAAGVVASGGYVEATGEGVRNSGKEIYLGYESLPAPGAPINPIASSHFFIPVSGVLQNGTEPGQQITLFGPAASQFSLAGGVTINGGTIPSGGVGAPITFNGIGCSVTLYWEPLGAGWWVVGDSGTIVY